ncbi:hypothetical protein Peur_063894 [Populus x canadensis]
MDRHHNEPNHEDEPNNAKFTRPLSGDGASTGKIFIGGLARERQLLGSLVDLAFVTYSDPSAVDQVIQDTHTINGKQVEIKGTIPKGAVGSKDFKTKRIFVGGIPAVVTEDEFKEFFKVTEHQIMRDHPVIITITRGHGIASSS